MAASLCPCASIVSRVAYSRHESRPTLECTNTLPPAACLHEKAAFTKVSRSAAGRGGPT